MISPMIVGTSPSPEMRARMETATARAQVEPKHALEKMTGLDNLPKKTAPPLPTRPFAEDDAKASSPDPVPAVVPPAAKAEDGASAMPGLRTPAPEPLVSAGVPPTAKAEECGPVMLPDPPLLLPEPPVSTLPPPTPKTEEAVLAPPEPAMPESPEPQAAKGYAIQVAAFIGPARQAKAEEYQRGLKAKSDWTTDLVASGDDECIRVLTGDYPDREMANKACRELKKRAGFAASFVRRRSQRSVTVTGSGEEPSLANVDASTATGSREKPSPVNVDASTAPEMQEAVVPADVQAETDTRETRQGLADGEEQPQKEATKLPGQVSGKRNFARTNKRVDETN